MSGIERRLAPFVLAVADLLKQNGGGFPHREIQLTMDDAFDAEPSYNWISAGGTMEFELLRPIPGWPQPEDLELWHCEGFALHPLLQWFAVTGSTTPQTVGRVPRRVAPPHGHEYLRLHLHDVGLDQQLSIPCGVTTGTQHWFVLARGDPDFSDADLELATRLQPLLLVLDRQRALLAELGDAALDAARDCRLTGREVAVLRLLSQGLTAVAIARQLGSSPRTVHKHLEHAYRKLGVRDRLGAVRIAAELGLLTSPPRLVRGPPGRVYEPRLLAGTNTH